MFYIKDKSTGNYLDATGSDYTSDKSEAEEFDSIEDAEDSIKDAGTEGDEIVVDENDKEVSSKN